MLEKTLEGPLDCKIKPVNPKGNQPWIFAGKTVTGLMLQYFGHLMQRADLLEKTLMLGKIEGRRRRGWQRMKWFDGITDSMDMSLSTLREWRTGKPGVLQSIGLVILSDWSTIAGHDLVTEPQECLCAQSYLALWDPVDCRLPGSSVHGIFQARIGMGCQFFRQGICLTQRLNLHLLCLLHWRQILYLLSHWGNYNNA